MQDKEARISPSPVSHWLLPSSLKDTNFQVFQTLSVSRQSGFNGQREFSMRVLCGHYGLLEAKLSQNLGDHIIEKSDLGVSEQNPISDW